MEEGIARRYFLELKKNLIANTTMNTAMASRMSRVTVIGDTSSPHYSRTDYQSDIK